MKIQRIIGIVLIALGGAMLAGSAYIKSEVGMGQERIQSAQRSVDTGNKLFSLSPYTKDVGKTMTRSAQKKIDEGRMEVAKYMQIAHMLQIGGFISLIGGAALLFLGRKQ
jgi:hypothetical protein